VAADTYANYADLGRGELEGRDFHIDERPGRSGALLLAPHGGAIEPGTAELADAIAGDDHAYYAFVGTRPSGNFVRLHITSTKFDEPRAVRAVARSRIAIAIHGARSTQDIFAMVGALDSARAERLRTALRQAGFPVRPAPPGLAGRNAANIVNRGGNGVQIEVSAVLRERIRRDEALCRRFVASVRAAIVAELVSMT
jgi:phage replication-related protein YjqB (UPF0714/DUF867 family)